MNLRLANQVTIAEHWVCPIEYGDYTGLEDFEIKALEEWLSDYPSATFVFGDADEFARCEVTGMMGPCVEVLIYEAA